MSRHESLNFMPIKSDLYQDWILPRKQSSTTVRPRPLSVHSLNPFNDRIESTPPPPISIEPPPECPFKRSSQSLKINPTVSKSKLKPTAKVPESISLTLSETNICKPEQWKQYVEASFPGIQEKGEISIKSEVKVDKKTPKALPQISKVQYSKLRQQSSVEEDTKSNPTIFEMRRLYQKSRKTNSAPEEEFELRKNSSPEKKEKVTLCLGGNCKAKKDDGTIVTPVINLEPEVGIGHIDDLKYPTGNAPCHFCNQNCSTSVHDDSRLTIVSGGLVQKNSSSATQYMNLPSPMLHPDEGTHSFAHRRTDSLDSLEAEEGKDIYPDDEERPSPTALFQRRQALTISRLTSSDVQTHKLSMTSGSQGNSTDRRSSIVVIPPMYVCPGDLLVYSKVLTNKQKVQDLGHNRNTDESRTKRMMWHIMKLFDRRGKTGSISDLEDVLASLKIDHFNDELLARYRSVTWWQFYNHVTHKEDEILFNDSIDVGDDDSYFISESSSLIQEEIESDIPRLFEDANTKITLKPDMIEFHQRDESPKSQGPVFAFSKKILRSHSSAQLPVTAPPAAPLNRPISLRLSFRDEILSKANPEVTKSKPKLLRQSSRTSQITDFFRKGCSPSASTTSSASASSVEIKKDEEAAPWPDKGKAEKQETSVKRFQKKLVRAQSEKVLNLSRFASWKRKDLDKEKEKEKAKQQEENMSPTSVASQGEYKRREAIWDLFQTECRFLFEHLSVLKCVYLERLKRVQVEGHVMLAEPQLLFGNLDELCRVTRRFCRSFIRLLKSMIGPQGELSPTAVLEELFRKNEDGDMMTQAYHSYALNYINALTYLDTLRTYAEFNIFEKFCSRDERCRKLSLTDLLVAPVQHIMKIPLILREIQARTENLREREIITHILEAEEQSLRSLDDKMKWLKNYEKLLELQKNLIWPSVMDLDPKLHVPDFIKPALERQMCDRLILSPRRKIIHEGLLLCWDSGKPHEMVVLLFDDMLLITKKKKSKRQKIAHEIATASNNKFETNLWRQVVYKQPLALDRMYVYEISRAERETFRLGLDFTFLLIVVNRFQQVITVHTLQATNLEDKRKWLTCLKDAQENYKKNLETTMFRPGSPEEALADLKERVAESASKKNKSLNKPLIKLSKNSDDKDEPKPETERDDWGFLRVAKIQRKKSY